MTREELLFSLFPVSSLCWRGMPDITIVKTTRWMWGGGLFETPGSSFGCSAANIFVFPALRQFCLTESLIWTDLKKWCYGFYWIFVAFKNLFEACQSYAKGRIILIVSVKNMPNLVKLCEFRLRHCQGFRLKSVWTVEEDRAQQMRGNVVLLFDRLWFVLLFRWIQIVNVFYIKVHRSCFMCLYILPYAFSPVSQDFTGWSSFKTNVRHTYISEWWRIAKRVQSFSSWCSLISGDRQHSLHEDGCLQWTYSSKSTIYFSMNHWH